MNTRTRTRTLGASAAALLTLALAACGGGGTPAASVLATASVTSAQAAPSGSTSTIPEVPATSPATVNVPSVPTVAPASDGNPAPMPSATDSATPLSIGTISIPTAGVTAPLYGTDGSKAAMDTGLDLGAVTARWGMAANVQVTGHRTHVSAASAHVFANLNKVAAGDVITTTANGVTSRWLVASEQVIAHRDAGSWASPTNTIDGKRTITLFACSHADGTPGGTEAYIMVRAVLA